MCTGAFCVQIAWNPAVRQCLCQEFPVGIYIAHEYCNLAIAVLFFACEAEDVRRHRFRLKARIRSLHESQRIVCDRGKALVTEQLRLDRSERVTLRAVLFLHQSDGWSGGRIELRESIRQRVHGLIAACK